MPHTNLVYTKYKKKVSCFTIFVVVYKLSTVVMFLFCRFIKLAFAQRSTYTVYL
jgi:hypothetical protein